MDRRTKEGYKLRVYMDQIKTVKAMSDAEWTDQWAKHSLPDVSYMSRAEWIAYLQGCAMDEATAMLEVA